MLAAVVVVVVAVLMVVLLMSRDSVEVDLRERFVQLAFEVLEKSESLDQADRVVFDLVAFDQAVELVLEYLYQEELDQVVPVDDNLEREDHHVEHPLHQLLLQSPVNPPLLPNIPNSCVGVVEMVLHRSIFLKFCLKFWKNYNLVLSKVHFGSKTNFSLNLILN